MSVKHPFFLCPGEWLGEGKIGFSASDEELQFYTHWNILDSGDVQLGQKNVRCTQEVEMQDAADEKMFNRFHFTEIGIQSFKILLENEQIGTVFGEGIIEKDKVAWEFRGHPHIEGFEVYTLGENGEYEFHAEYISPEGYRSIINGRIWKKQYSKKS
ncbi:MAG: hypothetical protein K940chlam3_00046 [Chlamydiae bacterium]|nr:hypothetical protein [Chlamydiota bacterium]